MELLYILLVLLLVSRVAGELAKRLGPPALVGELVGGISLGLLVQHYAGTFPVLADLRDNEVFRGFTDLAIFFLMLLAGIELHPRQLSSSTGVALRIAVGGMILPLAAGFGLAWFVLPPSPLKLAQSIFVATALSVTAVPVSVKMLMDLGKLKTRLGLTIVSAAVVDDVLALLLLAFLTAILDSGELPGALALVALLAQILAFFAIAGAIGHYAFPWIGRRLQAVQAEEFEFSALLISAFGFALLAEALSMHFILGAFVAGLFFGRRTVDPAVYNRINMSLTTFTMGLFAPLFFASVGMHLDVGAAIQVPLFVAALAVIAFAAKLLGAALPAIVSGFSTREALAIGAGMSARGAVELVIAEIALRAGVFDLPDPPPPVVAQLYSAIVIMALVTTLLGPLTMKWLIRAED